MDTIQQEINMHKSKLLNLVNNLINTQLIDDEISINNDIKTENECLKSLLNIKQNNPINQINQNFNINANPLMFQPNSFMNLPSMNMNPVIQNNFNSHQNNNVNKINVQFLHNSGNQTFITCEINTKFNDLINEYRRKNNDYNYNIFILNAIQVDPTSTSTIGELMAKCLVLSDHFRIVVNQTGILKGQ